MNLIEITGGDGIYWEDILDDLNDNLDGLNTTKQDALGTVGAAGVYMLEETALGVTSKKVPGVWSLFYTDASGGVKEVLIGDIGTFLKSNGTGGPPTFEVPSTPKVKMTAEGGLAIKVTNLSGGNSTKGYLVSVAPGGTNNGVVLSNVGTPDCIGVFYDSGVANGQEAWVVVSGIADVYFWTDTVNGHFARVGFASDTGEANGQAISESVPGSPFSTDKHFAEIGHVLEARTGAGLAKCVLHFN